MSVFRNTICFLAHFFPFFVFLFFFGRLNLQRSLHFKKSNKQNGMTVSLSAKENRETRWDYHTIYILIVVIISFTLLSRARFILFHRGSRHWFIEQIFKRIFHIRFVQIVEIVNVWHCMTPCQTGTRSLFAGRRFFAGLDASNLRLFPNRRCRFLLFLTGRGGGRLDLIDILLGRWSGQGLRWLLTGKIGGNGFLLFRYFRFLDAGFELFRYVERMTGFGSLQRATVWQIMRWRRLLTGLANLMPRIGFA